MGILDFIAGMAVGFLAGVVTLIVIALAIAKGKGDKDDRL